MRSIIEDGGNPFDQRFIIDVAHGYEKARCKLELCPTITKARASAFGFWDSLRRVRLNTVELGRLQGLDNDQFDVSMLPNSAVASMIGNAMTVGVIRRLMQQMREATM